MRRVFSSNFEESRYHAFQFLLRLLRNLKLEFANICVYYDPLSDLSYSKDFLFLLQTTDKASYVLTGCKRSINLGSALVLFSICWEEHPA